jgi:hypothetical protein
MFLSSRVQMGHEHRQCYYTSSETKLRFMYPKVNVDFLVHIRVIQFEVQLRLRKSFVDVKIMQLFVSHLPLATKCR